MADYRDDPARNTRPDAMVANRRTGVAGTEKPIDATFDRRDRKSTPGRREGGRSKGGRIAGAIAAVTLAVLLVAWLASDLFDASDDALTTDTAIEDSEMVGTGTEAEPLLDEETESGAVIVVE